MLKILHGDNVAASRNAYLAYKQNAQNPVMLRGGEFTYTDLVQIFDGGELFSDTKHVFIEDLFAKTKKGDELSLYTALLLSHAQENTIVLWEGKTLTKSQLNVFKDTVPELFKLPTLLFTLLDAIRPNNAPTLIKYAHAVKNEAGEEILFAMLIRQIRLLMAFSENADIDEVKRVAPWQKNKLVQQARMFSAEQLYTLHTRLYELDLARKTGTGSLPLSASIDFFLLRI